MKSIIKLFTKNLKTPNALSDKYDIIIHIGSPKTGTSALQNFFLRNKNVLLKQGFFYPDHGIDSNGISGGHSILAVMFKNKQIDDAKVVFNKWLSDAQSTNSILLLSSEAFFNRANEFNILLKDKRVLVIAYHRDIAYYYKSIHNQMIKRHYGRSTFVQYSKNILLGKSNAGNLINNSFLATYRSWEECVGKENIYIKHYGKKHFFNHKIESDFLHFLNLEDKYFTFSDKQINISYTEDTLEIKRILNFVLNRNENSLNNKIDLFLQSYSEKYYNSDTTQNILYNEGLYREMKFFFQEEEKQILKQYIGAEISTEEELKLSDKSEYTLSEEKFQHIMNQLISDPKIYEYLKSIVLDEAKDKNTDTPVYRLIEYFNEH